MAVEEGRVGSGGSGVGRVGTGGMEVEPAMASRCPDGLGLSKEYSL